MKKCFNLFAVCLTFSFVAPVASAADYSYNLDLSAGNVIQLNPRANGFISNSTTNSITLVGPNGNFYYPNLVTSLNIVAPQSVSSGASAYLTGNPSSISYLGEQSAQKLLTDNTSWQNIFSTNQLTRSDLTSLAGAGAPTSEFNFIVDPQSDTAYAFSYQHYEVRLSYDYSFTSPDFAGFDYASGTAGLNLNAPNSGHIDSLFSTMTNFNYSNLSILPHKYINTFNPPTSFNWSVGSTDNLGGAGILTISNLTVSLTQKQDVFYISNVPEPDTYAILLAGLGVMGFMARRKKSLG